MLRILGSVALKMPGRILSDVLAGGTERGGQQRTDDDRFIFVAAARLASAFVVALDEQRQPSFLKRCFRVCRF